MTKKLLAVLLTAFLVFSLMVNTLVFAEVNVDGGDGGEMGDAGQGHGWSIGDDGIRVTIVRVSDRQIMRGSVDFSNRAQTDIKWHYNYKSKLRYQRGEGLSLNSATPYVSKQLSASMPQIISASGGSNVVAIKTFFSYEGTIRDIANLMNFDYETLINGEYILLLEPIAYFRYYGKKVALSATEAALLDQQANGDLRKKMGNLTHQNMPLSMFLETPQIGFGAWGGAQSGYQSNADIRNYLGMGLVSFEELPETGDTGGIPLDKDYVFRTDTDVIISAWVRNGTGDDIVPTNEAKATFYINGGRYSTEFVLPEGERELVWVRWHTPSTPTEFDITVTTTKGTVEQGRISVAVVDLKEKEPPNPKGTDRNDGFRMDSIARRFENNGAANWIEWWATWIPNWEWIPEWVWINTGHTAACPNDCTLKHGIWEDEGEWVDNGEWEFDFHSYSASMTIYNADLYPDSHCYTSYLQNNKWTIKSGYGWQLEMPVRVTYSAPSMAVTAPQNAMAFFPEFNYQKYNRVLQGSGGLNPTFTFQSNRFSQYDSNTHFTPIWYPDGRYDVSLVAFDCWTPAGQLYLSTEAGGYIDGDVYDDWHIGPDW